jgi:hypothetical protein
MCVVSDGDRGAYLVKGTVQNCTDGPATNALTLALLPRGAVQTRLSPSEAWGRLIFQQLFRLLSLMPMGLSSRRPPRGLTPHKVGWQESPTSSNPFPGSFVALCCAIRQRPGLPFRSHSKDAQL